jgi:hypothetical protein
MAAEIKESRLARKASMTKADVRAWAARWQLVNDYERAELRRTSLDQKIRQLAALMASVAELGWDDVLAANEVEALTRWKQLRRAYGF